MTPLAWLGILAILLVIEAITVGLTTVWFAGGALLAMIAAAAPDCVPRVLSGTS